MQKIKHFLPFLEWLPKYNLNFFLGDLAAGLTVAVLLVPQGLAYALLAGLDPIYGLYAGIVPLLLYAFFGTSRQLSVGPTALISLIVLSGATAFAEVHTVAYLNVVILTALMAGVIQVLLGLFRLGFLINFLSHPVIVGFTSAAAVIISFSQLRNLLGLDLQRSNRIYEIIVEAASKIQYTDLLTLAIGVGGIAIMLTLKRISKAIPSALVVVVLSTLLVWGLQLDQRGIAIVGSIPDGLPAFQLPTISIDLIVDLLPLAFTVSLISFIESLAIAKTIEARQKSYRVFPNQELIALGLTKIGGAFFQSFPTTGSFSRSAINDEAGAKTGISSVISAIFVAVILLFLTPLFYYLPKAVLASIIMVSVLGLIGLKEAKYLWKNDRKDFLTLAVTFIATLAIGIQAGVATGILLSIAQIIYQSSKPHFAVLGRIPNSSHYRNIERFPNAIQPTETLVIRFDAQLYFGNATFFRTKIENLVADYTPNLKRIVLDASSMTAIDSSGIHIFQEILDHLEERNIQFCLADAIGPVRDTLYKTGLMDRIGFANQFMHVNDAINYFEGNTNGILEKRSLQATQQNVE